MAKFIEQIIQITVSKMVKNSETLTLPLDKEQISQLESIVEELTGNGTIVEISVGKET